MPWSSVRWFLAAPGDFSSDCVAFIPDEGPLGSAALRFDGAAELPCSDGALCWTVEPADGASRLCALANPVPAISAAAATEIIKRLVMESSPHEFALPAPTTKADVRCSPIIAVPSGLFLWMPDEPMALKRGQRKRPARQPALQLCAEHVRQLGGESLLPSLMAAE